MLENRAIEAEFFQPSCEGGKDNPDLSGLVRGVKLGFC